MLLRKLTYPLAFTVTLVLTINPLFSQETLVNRRVLLVDFANLQNNPNYGYMEGSLPEAMLTALQNTGNFDLLPMDTWQNLVSEGTFEKNDNKSEKRARAAAASQQADVLLLGSFIVADQDLRITARAIDVETGRIIVSKKERAKTDGSMFTAIDKLAAEMAKEMKEKLPPLPPREIIRERVKVIDGGKGALLWRSALMPGWGNLYASQWRGWFYMGAFLGAAGYSFLAYQDYQSKASSYQSLSNGSASEYNTAYEEANKARQIALYSTATTLGIYVLGLADVAILATRQKGGIIEPMAFWPGNGSGWQIQLGRYSW